MDVVEKRAVAQVFIDRIIVSQTGSHKVADVVIRWRDGSTDELVLPYRSDTWVLWDPTDVEILSQLLKEQASQIEIMATLPKRNWRAIRIKVYEILGERNFHISPKPIRDKETYEDYLVRLDRDGNQANRTSGNQWRKDGLQVLAQVIKTGATQLEIATVLPRRSWEAIRKKIAQVHGKGIIVPETGFLQPSETILDYLESHPDTAEAMPFAILTNCSQRKHSKKP